MRFKFEASVMVHIAAILFISLNTFAEKLNEPAMTNSDSTTISFRYIVDNVESSVNFYRDVLDFKVILDKSPGCAMLTRGNFRLFLNKPGAGGAGQAMPDGEIPKPGGWNRIQLEVSDLEAEVKKLKGRKAKFRNDIVVGIGGKQILLEDPSGNVIELFEPGK
jgi:predicted enzyme related to lactoylglutathione lyase